MLINRTARDRESLGLHPHTRWGHLPFRASWHSERWRIEWNAGRRWIQAGLQLTLNRMEGEATLNLNMPGLGLWISRAQIGKHIDAALDQLGAGQVESREWKACAYTLDEELIVEWSFCVDPDSTDFQAPWWRRTYINVKELLLGHFLHDEAKHARHQVKILVPDEDGEPEAHDAAITISSKLFGRKRVPKAYWSQAWIALVEFSDGPEVPGKGTTDYNCGPSQIQSLSIPISGPHAIEEAIAGAIQSTLRDRRRYPL